MNDELDPYFENDTRASEWRALRIALMRRLAALENDAETTDDPQERARLQREIDSLKSQVDTLLIEEVSQQFAEDALRVTIAVQHLDEAQDIETYPGSSSTADNGGGHD
jgi:hypothetical protein